MLANNDRVNERYYGLINAEKSHEATRTRIHWICKQVVGSNVLDIGCSQGITSILLAREGFKVTGIDLDISAINYAKSELQKESIPVRNRVKFNLNNIFDINTSSESFDTIILGEILEHFSHPDRLLAQAHRLLKKRGKIVITVPFGFHPFYDHKQSFYIGNLSACLERYFSEDRLEVHHKYLCFAGHKKNLTSRLSKVNKAHVKKWMELEEAHFLRIEQDHYREMNQRKAALDRAVQRIKELERSQLGAPSDLNDN